MDMNCLRAAGLDVPKKRVVAGVLTPEGRQTRSFGTMTADLLALADWLVSQRVTQVAMERESTGVFWKPVYNVLEEEPTLTALVVNAQHIKALPGRKTDVKDAEWLADLVRHGLVRPSFIPDRPGRELRELVRYRRTLIPQRAQVVNRIQQVLEDANSQLRAVASAVAGVSGRARLEALVAGDAAPAALADLAKSRWREQRPALEAALAHQDTIPGIGVRGAQEVVAESGLDMCRFPTADHLASWAKVCPGNNESAGKQKSGRTGHGNPWLRAALVEAAWAAAHTNNSYLAAHKQRIAARRGGKRAALAVAHTILLICYHLLQGSTNYQDRGSSYFDERQRHQTLRRALERTERLGYQVSLEAA